MTRGERQRSSVGAGVLWLLLFTVVHPGTTAERQDREAVPPVDVELVVNVCHEHHLHFVETVANEVLRSFAVRTTYYCKCGQLVPGCIELPNVGREAHSFLHHMVSRYDSLGAPPPHWRSLHCSPRLTHLDAAPVTYFINGGMGASAGSSESVFLTTHALAALGLQTHFVDKTMAIRAPMPRAIDAEWGGSTDEFVARARKECPDPTACCKLCKVSHCCRLFGAGLCPLSEDRLFDEQTQCAWGGKNLANYNATFDKHLRPASPPSFAAWLQERWGISLHTFEKQQWSPGGIFAVARDGIRSWPVALLTEARSELEESGLNGGTRGAVRALSSDLTLRRNGFSLLRARLAYAVQHSASMNIRQQLYNRVRVMLPSGCCA